MESSVHSVGARSFALPLRDKLAPLGVWLLGCVFVIVVAGSAGGFRPTAWAWTALLTWWIAVGALILKRRFSTGLLELTTVGGVVGLTGWFALSALWSHSVPSTLDDTVRYVAYAGLVVATLLIVERATVNYLVGGVTAGVGVLGLYALGTRVLPDRLTDFSSTAAGYRLSEPITYWNGLGVFCAMGALLALGFAIRSPSVLARIGGAALLPPLLCAMYFTFSRGAWLSLLIGLAVGFAIDPRRLQFAFAGAVTGLPSALAVLLASRADGLTVPGASLDQATQDGHRLVWQLLIICGLSAGTAAALGLVERRVDVPGPVRIAWAATLVAAGIVAVCITWGEVGSPVHVAQRVWDQANSSVTHQSGAGRLFNLSANGRFEVWHAGWDTFREHPAAGTGGGTYWQSWAGSPRQTFSTIEPHSIYFGTLAELGLIGFALLLVLLVPPVAAALRSRRSPLIPFVLAAYIGWLAHSAVDWDWTLVGVSGVGFLCGSALLVSARGRGVDSRRPVAQGGAAALAVVVALFSLSNVIANERLGSANDALVDGANEHALSLARSARRFAPWSVDALGLEATARLEQGRKAEALALYRRIAAKDPNSWVAWTQVAELATGAERRAASARAVLLNPKAPRV